MFENIILRQFLAIAAAGAGALLAVSAKKISHRTLCVLISFAAGALLAVSLADIVPEAVELAGLAGGLISVLTGYLLFFLITRFVSHICPACAATHTEINFKAVTITMLAALSVHSFMDGLAIYSGISTDHGIGVLIFLAVAYHKFPEGMALALIARGSGMSRLRAFTLTFGLESVTTLAGGFAGLTLLRGSEPVWAGYILGHVAGGFIFLVIHALLSEVIKHHPRSTIFAASLGALSILVFEYLF